LLRFELKIYFKRGISFKGEAKRPDKLLLTLWTFCPWIR